MRVRIDDEVFELADDPTIEQRVRTAMARNEVWQVHPAAGPPVTVAWPRVALFQVLPD
jgi:hypothetical protein